MFCIKCQKGNTKCVDDMLQPHYISEIYKCMDCEGTIEVEYDTEISVDSIKDYHYYTTS